jgi:WD40 repeat protein/DNA-binding SARP family transcriptional activator/ABC-type transport system involved in cytochrome c biogenesis ATPase subunit
MKFHILGPLEVRGESGPLALGGAKPRAALAVLLLHPNIPVSAERLALALWGEDAPAGATKTVQVHISRLRKALDDPEVIVTSAAGYCLRVGPGELDAAEFERLADDGRQALAGGQTERAAGLLREALGLWRGTPLADLALDTFHEAEISRLEERRLVALETRVEADLASGRQAELIAELRQLTVANPTRERFAAQLMVALYRCGRQAEALETYQETRRSLIAELGVEPGPWLRELQESILRQDVALDPGAVVAELPAELDTTTAPPLVGREDELAWLRLRWERARRNEGGLLIVAGPRGSGKSRLVAQLAGDVHRNGDAVLYAGGATRARTTVALLTGLSDAVRPTLVVLDDADGATGDVLAQLASTAARLGPVSVLVLVCCGDPDRLSGVQCDGVLTLEPLGTEAVRAIGGGYATSRAAEDIPAQWLREASAGLPRRVHEVASQWARREAARRVSAVAGRAADERAQLRTIEEELVGEVAELQEASVRALPRRTDGPEVTCPFKGLASYEGSDAAYFFGRERLVAELVARLVGANLLAVVGSSGGGKSSVLRAGLLPALASGVLPQSEEWSQVLMRPGEHPLRELDAVLDAQDPDGHVVLAVDQFEELFTVCADDDERTAFVEALVGAAADPTGRYTVVLALRADHYGRCAVYPDLSRLLAANHVLVRSMQRDELRRAIEGPCERSGLRIEQELVDALVTDVEREPGGLPLLSSALLELWQHREGRRLRLAAYERIGGVRGAVARLAEDAYGRIDPSGQVVAQRVLLRLVGAGDDGVVERRRVRLEELEIAHRDDVAGVVALLTDRRLLTVDEHTVEIAHEALLREWPRLHDWIEEDLDGLRIQTAVSAAADEWERLGRDDGALLRGSRLNEAVELLDARRVVLNERELVFLAAGEAASARERITRRRRTRVVLAAATMLLLASVAVGVAALFAARDRASAASREIAARSVSLLNSNPQVALALARVALVRDGTAQAQDALRQAAFDDRATAVLRASSTGSLYAAVPTGDGRSVVTAGKDGSLRIWRLGHLPAGRLLTQFGSPALSAAVSPDDSFAASTTENGQVAKSPLRGGPTTIVKEFAADEQGFATGVSGSGIAVGTSLGNIWMIPTRDGRKPYVLGRDPHPGASVLALAFNPAGTEVASGDAGADGISGGAYVWNTTTGRSVHLNLDKSVTGLAFSPNGALLATVGADGTVRLWNAKTGAARGALNVTKDPLGSVGFSSDDARVVTTSANGVIAITDLRTGKALSQMQSGSPELTAAFVPRSSLIVSANQDGTLAVWTPAGLLAAPVPGMLPSFASDGRSVISGGTDGVHLWDLASGGDRRLPGTADASVAAFSPDDGKIVSTSVANPDVDVHVYVYDPATGRSRRLAFPAFTRYAVATSRSGKIAVGGGSSDGSTGGKWIVYVENADGTDRVELRGATDVSTALAFSPDGKRLAGASFDGSLRIWNVLTGVLERRIEVDAAGVNDVSWNLHGTQLATADSDGTVGIWPVTAGPPVFLLGHVGPVDTVKFNPAGDRIVSTGQDGTVRVWSAAGGDTLVVLHQTVGGPANGAAFSPDGASVVSYGTDGMFITPCEVCGSFADAQRIAGTRAGPALSASELQRLASTGT